MPPRPRKGFPAAVGEEIVLRPCGRKVLQSGQWPKAESLGGTNRPLLTVGLVQRGYQDDAIRKILGQNILRVCRDALTPS